MLRQEGFCPARRCPNHQLTLHLKVIFFTSASALIIYLIQYSGPIGHFLRSPSHYAKGVPTSGSQLQLPLKKPHVASQNPHLTSLPVMGPSYLSAHDSVDDAPVQLDASNSTIQLNSFVPQLLVTACLFVGVPLLLTILQLWHRRGQCTGLRQNPWMLAGTVGYYEVKRRQVQSRARQTIRVCAALWKLGYIEDCERQYRKLYHTLLSESEVATDRKMSTILREALRACQPELGHRNCVKLQEGLDKIIKMPLVDEEWDENPWQPQELEEEADAEDDADLKTLVDFSQPPPKVALHTDRMLGGDSIACLTHQPDKQCTAFEGIVGIGSGASFASAWVPQRYPDMTKYSGFYIDCCVPQKFKYHTFCITVMTKPWMSYKVSSKSGFQAPAKAFARVLIPFSSFSQPTRWGRKASCSALEWDDIGNIGFIIERPYTGPFCMYVREIGVYR